MVNVFGQKLGKVEVRLIMKWNQAPGTREPTKHRFPGPSSKASRAHNHPGEPWDVCEKHPMARASLKSVSTPTAGMSRVCRSRQCIGDEAHPLVYISWPSSEDVRTSTTEVLFSKGCALCCEMAQFFDSPMCTLVTEHPEAYRRPPLAKKAKSSKYKGVRMRFGKWACEMRVPHPLLEGGGRVWMGTEDSEDEVREIIR
jgi:hypothetical protein